MDELDEYIDIARTQGQTDKQIQFDLLKAGWKPKQIDMGLSTLHPTSIPIPTKPKPFKKRRKLPIFLSIIIFLLIIVLVFGLVTLHKKQPPSITFYYSDGKSIIWKDTDPNSNISFDSSTAPYFASEVNNALTSAYGRDYWNQGSWKVTTTLNKSLETDAMNDLNANAANVASANGNQQAMVAENVRTGQVVASVGGTAEIQTGNKNYDFNSLNLSPGSSIEPFVYAALIENNHSFGAGSEINDAQIKLPGYPCTNTNFLSAGGNCLYDNSMTYTGLESIRYALGGARNVPAVEALDAVVPNDTSTNKINSVNKFISLTDAAIGVKDGYECYKFGADIVNPRANDTTQCYGSSALGGGYLTLSNELNGDATLARLGQEIPESNIISISLNNKTKYTWSQPKSTQVYTRDTSYIINNILDDPNASYLSSSEKFQSYKNWSIAVMPGVRKLSYGIMGAWTSQYALVNFAGNDNLDTFLAQGHNDANALTEPVAKAWIDQAIDLSSQKASNWPKPKDIKTIKGYQQITSPGGGAVVPGPVEDLFPSNYIE